MFIQTETTTDPAVLRFLPGRDVLGEGTVDLHDRTQAKASPLAERLFAISGVSAVSLGRDSITVTKNAGEWQHLKPAILGAIVEHFIAGVPILTDSAASLPHGLSTSAGNSGEGELSGRIKDALRAVIDPELGFNIVDLGLIYAVDVADGGAVRITMSTTTPGCPATSYLKQGTSECAGAVPGVECVEVQLTYDPRWSPEMMSAEAKARFGIRNGGHR